MSMRQIKARYEGVKTLGFAAIGADWAPVVDFGGASGAITHPARIYHIVNNTDADLYFVWGTSAAILATEYPFLLLPAGAKYTEDLCANQALTNGFALPEGSLLYVKHTGAAPSVKSIWLTVCYASEK